MDISPPTRVIPAGTVYMAANVASSVLLVLLNKLILSTLRFKYSICLTFLHAVTTFLAMEGFGSNGVFEKKKLSVFSIMPLVGAYVGYIALSNLSLRTNSVAIYTITKVAVAPCVLLLEVAILNRKFSVTHYASVAVVCLGVAICTVQDLQLRTSSLGAACALAAVFMTALYQLWAGSKQKDLQATSAQLLHQSAPYAILLLALLVAVFEPVVPNVAQGGSIVGYPYTWASVSAILLSCVLGMIVSLSTFLAIGATSSLNFTVIGHIKTVSNLFGGYLFFGDTFTPIQVLGIMLALSGIGWFAQLKSAGQAQPTPQTAKGPAIVLAKPKLTTTDSLKMEELDA